MLWSIFDRGGGGMTFDELKEKAHALPLKPGVYIMQDAQNLSLIHI